MLFVGLIGLPLAALAGISWYYSESFKNEALEPDREPDEFDMQVVEVDAGTITLRRTDRAEDDGDWTQQGTFGLQWQGGYGQVGAILEVGHEEVVRAFVPGIGSPAVGELVRMDSFAFPANPMNAHGIPFVHVTYQAPSGAFPAWFVAGTRDVWAIFVHGRGASRREALRALPAPHNLGIAALVITYRNDPEAEPSSDGFHGFGETEWEDLQAATQYALNQGAKRIVLVGYSMGGGIVMSFLYRSQLADRVAAVILDSPMLDLSATADSRSRGVLGPLRTVGKAVVAWRFGVSWDDLNYLKNAHRLTTPVLLFHGDEDQRVPVSTSDALANARPDIVTYVRLRGVGHVRSWNSDPVRYETAIRGFLEASLPGE